MRIWYSYWSSPVILNPSLSYNLSAGFSFNTVSSTILGLEFFKICVLHQKEIALIFQDAQPSSIYANLVDKLYLFLSPE